MSSPKPQKVHIDESLAVPIVGDAGFMTKDVADGRMLAVLILDTSGRPEIAELIRIHEHLPPGDVLSQWGSKVGDDDTVVLMLRFVRPMELELPLVFSIEKDAILIEALLTAGGVYLQAGNPGDRLIATMDAGRILVELPDQGFRPIWDKLLMDRMVKVMARRMNVRRRQARPKAAEFVKEIRKLTALRMRP